MLTTHVTTLALDPRPRAALRRHALLAPDRECCGVLLGAGGRVTRSVRVPNSATRSASAYLIPARRFRRIEHAARAACLDVIGFYHSHADTGAEPSAADLAQAWPGWVYLIIGFTRIGRCDIAAWRLRADRAGFEPVALSESAS